MPRLAAPILAAALALPAAAQETPLLDVAVSEDFGPHLVGRDGRPVYAFVTDVRGGDDITPLLSCQERCLEDWPLVTAEGDRVPILDGVSRFLVDTIDWKGENVVVYASNALFYYFRDEPGGEPRGQEVHTWGGWWYLVRPDGDLIVTGIAPETDG
jgi:predicted lipoprotein with Yx(FWY)xxD motif